MDAIPRHNSTNSRRSPSRREQLLDTRIAAYVKRCQVLQRTTDQNYVRLQALEEENAALRIEKESLQAEKSRQVTLIEDLQREKREQDRAVEVMREENQRLQAQVRWFNEDIAARLESRRCTVCLAEYNDTTCTPSCLPCGHSACQNCIRSMPSRGRGPSVLVTCFECRHDNWIRPRVLPRLYSLQPGYVRPRPN